jgi:hypothetical protein
MNIFLDTEFTDFNDCDLISIGLVADDGRDFYAELTDYRQEACNDFVKETVLPLLKKHPTIISGNKFQVAKELNEWLRYYDDGTTIANICVDFNGDWMWMAHLFSLLPPDELVRNIKVTNIYGSLDKMKLEYFWMEQGDIGWSQHHALWDAYGNRYAYMGSFDPTQNV